MPLTSTRGMPGTVTVANRLFWTATAGRQARMAPEKARPSVPTTVQTPASAIAATGLASRVSVATVVGPATKTSSVVVASRA